MDNINLYNRFGTNIWLEHIEDDLWKLKTDDKDILAYIRIVFNEDKSIFAIDPPGGPFLHVGLDLRRNMKYNKAYLDTSYEIVEISDDVNTLRLKEIKI